MTDHVKTDWTLEEVAVLACYLADNYATAREVADAVEKPWKYTDEYLRAVGMPEDAEVVTLTVVEDTAHLCGDEVEAIMAEQEARFLDESQIEDESDDPCCLLWKQTYYEDHERDCPARLRQDTRTVPTDERCSCSCHAWDGIPHRKRCKACGHIDASER